MAMRHRQPLGVSTRTARSYSRDKALPSVVKCRQELSQGWSAGSPYCCHIIPPGLLRPESVPG